MADIGVNFEQVAAEYSDIPDSIRSLHKAMSGSIESLESNFVGTGLEGAEATVASYAAFEDALEPFDTEITYLMAILRSQTTPDSVDDIRNIKTACDQLCSAADQFQSDCFRFAESLAQAGMTDASESFQTLAEELGAVTPEVERSFLDNQLLTAIRAHHFPSTVAEDVPDIIDGLDAADLQSRQNSYFVLTMAAREDPAAVVQYASQLASNLSTVSQGEQRNLLALLNILQSHDETQNLDVASDALNLVDSADPTVSLYASILLAKQATTAKQAQVITTRIESLLTQDIGAEARVNATFALYKLAESHPDAVAHVTPTVADLLTDEQATVQENVIEFLIEIGATEYRADIEEVRSNSADDGVTSAADTALETLSADTASSIDAATGDSSSQDRDSILDDIEDAFEEL